MRDTGIGIPPDRMDRLFQSFSQVDASTTRRYGGTGLGLAISKRLCELMGGTMWVESKGVPGEGSTFHFTIRAQAAPALAQRAHLRGLQPQLAGKRVLIVDDNPTNRRIVTLQTQSWGMIPHDTGLARGGAGLGAPRRSLRCGLSRPPDARDGRHLPGREIRSLRDEASLPIVILSSWGQREIEAGEAPYVAFLIKPLKASQIYDVLVSLFGTEEEIAELVHEPAGSQFDAGMAERHPLRILLAEDNAINQKLALRLLGRMGYRADVAANGVEVLRSLHRQPYDVVLMDVQMPEMDGLEATRAIWREWPAGQRPRIVAMTANAMKEDRDECLAAGMDDYLSKPIHVEELVRALQAAQPLPSAACPLPVAPQPEQAAPPEAAAPAPRAEAPTPRAAQGEPSVQSTRARPCRPGQVAGDRGRRPGLPGRDDRCLPRRCARDPGGDAARGGAWGRGIAAPFGAQPQVEQPRFRRPHPLSDVPRAGDDGQGEQPPWRRRQARPR